MREILFRGKAISTNQWVCGGYYAMGPRTFIVTEVEFETNWNIDTQTYKGYRMIEVHPNSVGQYIEQHDSVGDPIFENNIVYVPEEDEYADIVWDEHTSRFILSFDGWYSDFNHFHGSELEIAGNTFEGRWWEET